MALAGALAAPTPAQAGFTTIYAFGDSLSDNGSSLTAMALGASAPSRTSDGPVAVEVLANRYGAALHDYAVVGATTGAYNNDYSSANALHASGMRTQVATYLAGVSLGSGAADPAALYVLAGGSNDVLEALALGSLTDESARIALFQSMIGNLLQSLGELYAFGARHFVLSLLPDLGATPQAQALQIGSELTALSEAFNVALLQAYGQVAAATPDAQLVAFDLLNAQRQIIQSPGAHGLSNVGDACLWVDPGACDQFFYWDALHPTATASRLIADRLEAVIPEPGTLALAALMLAALAQRRARRS